MEISQKRHTYLLPQFPGIDVNEEGFSVLKRIQLKQNKNLKFQTEQKLSLTPNVFNKTQSNQIKPLLIFAISPDIEGLRNAFKKYQINKELISKTRQDNDSLVMNKIVQDGIQSKQNNLKCCQGFF